MDFGIIQLLPVEAQALGAFALFVLFMGIKRFPRVRAVLDTPRKKQLTIAVLAAAITAAVLYQTMDPRALIGAALNVFLAAMGVNALRPSKSKPAARLPRTHRDVALAFILDGVAMLQDVAEAEKEDGDDA